jgi:ABC-type Fe3+ transport system permease subunit
VQTGLFSWLDYGLVSMIGGGHVSTLTLRLFALIREASIHQAALASLLLTLPSLLAVAFLFLRDRLTAFPLVESPTDATFVKELP